MGRPVLLLRLEGPLQSWGTRARWDVRDTAPEPTKSGVIGLLGCALGYRVGDPRVEELDRGLVFGVRVEAPGRIEEDYQTITDYLPTAEGTYRHSGVGTARSLIGLLDKHAVPSTIVSPRAYLHDAAFLVALGETGTVPGLLERCRAALERPVWPPYLGRKACIPTRPILETLTEEYEGVEAALRKHPWSWLGTAAGRREAPTHDLLAYVENEHGDLVRQDAVRTNAARLYGFRRARALRIPLAAVCPGGER